MTVEWHDKAVNLRTDGLTYREIGEKFGVTRERVRQVLKELSPELCGHIDSRQRMVCKQCGEVVLKKKRWEFCSRRCSSKYKATHPTDREHEIFALCVEARKRGLSWRSVNKQLGWADTKTETPLGLFKKICAKKGIDPSPYMGFCGRTP